MTIQRMENVGIVVDDLTAATAFFVELGPKPQGTGPVEGGWVDRVVGLEGVRAEIAMVERARGCRVAAVAGARSPADAQLATVNLTPNEFRGEWNYSIKPSR